MSTENPFYMNVKNFGEAYMLQLAKRTRMS